MSKGSKEKELRHTIPAYVVQVFFFTFTLEINIEKGE